MREDKDCTCINILQFRVTLSLQKHSISWTRTRKSGNFIQKFGTQILKMVNIAKCLHAFFSASCGMQKLFRLLSYSTQANCQIQSYAYPSNSSINMDRTKPHIICSDLHQELMKCISGIFTSTEGKHFAIGTILFPLTYLLGLHLIFKSNNNR